MKVIWALLVALMFIPACVEDNFLNRMHERAKKEQTTCYLIIFPKDLAGYYCLRFIPKVPMKPETTFKGHDPFAPKEDK